MKKKRRRHESTFIGRAMPRPDTAMASTPEPVVDTGSLNTTTDDSLVVSAASVAAAAASTLDRETAIVSPTAPRRRTFRLMPPRGGDRSSEDEDGGREIQVLKQVRKRGGGDGNVPHDTPNETSSNCNEPMELDAKHRVKHPK